MNKELYGNKVELPEEVMTYLGQCFDTVDGADGSVEGYNRNQELRDSGYVTYQQLKRMKNWFDNFEGPLDDVSYVLNGADYVKNWVNNTLENLRNGTKKPQELRKEFLPDDVKINNSELKNFDVLGMDHKTPQETYGLNVEHEIKRIKQIIKTN